MIFNYNYTKLDLLGKNAENFLCNFEEFYLGRNTLVNENYFFNIHLYEINYKIKF